MLQLGEIIFFLSWWLVVSESERLASLKRFAILDSPPEAAYQGIVEAASRSVDAPIAALSFLDAERQWFKAQVGLGDVTETPRDASFCAYSIDAPDTPLIVEDALLDPRFAENPLVLGSPHIRFYAGFPIRDPAGNALGSLCVIDRVPRALSGESIETLSGLAAAARELVRLRLQTQVQHVQLSDLSAVHETAASLATRLDRTEHRFSSLIDMTPDPVMLLSSNGEIEAMNHAAQRSLSITGKSLIGESIDALAIPAPTRNELERCVAEALESGEQVEIKQLWFKPVVGPAGWLRVRVLPVINPADGTISILVSGVNITSSVENELRLATLALIDPLTGASNRRALYDRLDQALARLERGGSEGVAIAMIDLDYFKSVNDTYGHDVGDAALVAVVQSLRSAVRSKDTVARFGGDEFVVLFDDVDEDLFTNTLAPRLLEQFKQIAVPLPNGHVGVHASIGLAWSERPIPGRDLISTADNALRRAKANGRDRVWRASEHDRAKPFATEAALRRDLAQALRFNQFTLRYQPIVDLTGHTTSMEALLRWEHPEHGTLLPAHFMNVLIESGMIGEVGHWVMGEAIGAAALFSERQPTDMHINLGPTEVANTQLSSVVNHLVQTHEIEPRSIVIEITEQALMGTQVSTSAVAELASTGVRLTLDDFGTGTSSLAHLRHRPLAGLKLDQSFVAGIGYSEPDMAILSGTINIARELGLDVIAEGVETVSQREWLVDQGCTHLQGWLLGMPETFINALARLNQSPAITPS